MDTIPILKITHQNYSPYVSLFSIFDFIWILMGLMIFDVGYDGLKRLIMQTLKFFEIF